MACKDLLVVVDAEPNARERVQLAAKLAERFGAHLVGLYVAIVPEMRQRSGLFDAALLDPLLREARETSREQAEAARRLFDDVAGQHELSAEWRTAAGYPGDVVAVHGRYADLVILSQLDPDDTRAPLIRPQPEEVTLLAGRPILVIPYAGRYEQIGRRVLVGWDASRAATRAVNDALPLLAAASAVTVLNIDPKPSAEGHGEVPGADIALHLARHGVAARVETTVSAGIGVGNTLLSRASDIEADLLVMGAYGHSRVRELLLGGATRTVLESMTLPVLMSH